MDRFNFYFRQKVTEEEMDNAFNSVEGAISDWAGAFEFTGIAAGADVAEKAPTPNMHVTVDGPAVIYDKSAQHIAWASAQDVACDVDENGQPTAVAGGANSKWLSIFAHFERNLSDPRTDGFGDTVYYNEAESFSLRVVQGIEGVSPTRPGLDGTDILLADVLLTFGMTQITNGDIDTTRTELVYLLTGSPNSVAERSLHDALQAMLDAINTFEGDLSDLETRLADDTVSDEGTKLVGAAARTQAGLDRFDLAQGTVSTQLQAIIDALGEQSGSFPGDSRIGADQVMSGNIDLSQGTVMTHFTDLVGQLAAMAGTDGAGRIGAKAVGGLAAGTVRSQLDQVLVNLYANQLYGASFYGPTLKATDASANYYFTLFKSGNGGKTFSMVTHVRDGGLLLCFNIQVKSAGTGFEIVDNSNEAFVYHYKTVTSSEETAPLEVLRFEVGHATDLGSGLPTAEDAKTELGVNTSVTGGGTLWRLRPDGPETNADQRCHFAVGKNCSGANDECDAHVVFRSKFTAVPTSFTISVTAAGNCSYTTPTVRMETHYGCSINGFASAGAGDWYAYGYIDVAL